MARSQRHQRAQAKMRTVEHKMEKLIGELRAFEQFKEEVLPMLREDLAAGLDPEELRKKYAALAEARVITIALSDPDSGKALAAAKDLRDRAEGRAVERREVKHDLSELDDSQLEALIESNLKVLED